MKKIAAFFIAVLISQILGACSSINTADKNEISGSTSPQQDGILLSETEALQSSVSTSNTVTPITLTIGDDVLNGYLNDSVPAQSLAAQLPITVSLNDSDNDFCGGQLDIEYSDSDVQSGYKNGDLAFWTPANNFVIFVDDEENSADTGNLIILGRITEQQDVLDTLEGNISVTLALADNADVSTAKTDFKAETELPEAVEIISTVSDDTDNDISEESELKVKITVGDTELIATMENNVTTQAIIEQMPMTLPMMDLYGREMCYRYGAYALPTDNLQSDGYEVGDIAYWAPGGSLVILYAQNGEKFERQHLGHIDSGTEIFENIGDIDVTFSLVE